MNNKATILLLIPLLLPVGASSCTTEGVATPQEQHVLEQLDNRIEAAEREYSELEERAKTLLLDIEGLLEELALTPDSKEKQAIREELNGKLIEFDETRNRLTLAGGELLKLEKEASDIETTIGDRQGAGAVGLISLFDPKLGALAALFAPLAVRLGFKRSRKHLIDSAKYAATLGISKSISSFAKALGFSHSQEDLDELLARALEATNKGPIPDDAPAMADELTQEIEAKVSI